MDAWMDGWTDGWMHHSRESKQQHNTDTLTLQTAISSIHAVFTSVLHNLRSLSHEGHRNALRTVLLLLNQRDHPDDVV